MAREGYIKSIIIDEALNPIVIAGLCKMPVVAYQAEVDATVAGIIQYGAERPMQSEIIFYDSETRYVDDDEDCDRDFLLTAKIGPNAKELVFEFVDMGDGKLMAEIIMPFHRILSALAPYRRLVNEAEGTQMHKHKASFFDQLRADLHEQTMDRLGSNTGAHHDEYWIQIHMGKYLTSLVIALFPKGPAQDWDLHPSVPTKKNEMNTPGPENG